MKDFCLHDRENNESSEAHLVARRKKLSRQCAMVFDLLRQGKRLTTMNAPSYHIGDLRRRIKDLRDMNGVHIDEEWELDKDGKTTRNKVWFINHKTTKATKKSVAEHWKKRGEGRSSKWLQQDLI